MKKKILIMSLCGLFAVCIGITTKLAIQFGKPDVPMAEHDVAREVNKVPENSGYTPGRGIASMHEPAAVDGTQRDQEADGVLAFDDDNLREVAGFFDDVFVGKVTSNLSTDLGQALVLTRYEVEVVDVLKGDLRGSVEVKQQGGVIDGYWTIYYSKEKLNENTTLGASPHKNLLVPGQVYLFTTIQNDVLKTNLIGPSAVSHQLLNVDGSKSAAEIRSDAARTDAVKDMRAAVAYPIEPGTKN